MSRRKVSSSAISHSLPVCSGRAVTLPTYLVIEILIAFDVFSSILSTISCNCHRIDVRLKNIASIIVPVSSVSTASLYTVYVLYCF